MATTETKAPREAVAEHKLLDSQGNVIEAEEDATGISYTHKATGETFTWQLPAAGATGDAETRMFAIFGMKTLATNVASASKQRKDGVGAVDSILERFNLIRSGKWVERQTGPRYDVDTLVRAIELAKTEAGAAFDEADTRAKLASPDKLYANKTMSYASFAMSNRAVKAHYDALRPAKAEAELTAL